MSLIKKLTGTIAEARHIEDLTAQLAKSQADIEYIAIMTDTELGDDTEAVEEVE